MIKKIVSVTLLVLMSLAVVLTPAAIVLGQNTNLGVQIIQVVPASQANSGQATSGTYTGSVGDAFNLQGTIYTNNGAYHIIFGNQIVASGTSSGYYVNSNFTVPQLPVGGYNLILEDVGAGNLNSTGTSPETFTINTAYSISPVSPYIQEGSSVVLNVTVTGGDLSTSYVANVSVVLPSPLNANYSQTVTLGTPNQLGTANAQVTFPSSSFQPSGSNSNYAGSYTLYFNESSSLAQSQLSVGFLDSDTYHRGQTATVKALGYQPNQDVTLSIVNAATGSSLDSKSVTASADGVISTTWVVPSDTAIGSYNATITPQGTQKAVIDSQTFSIPGYPIEVTTVNLAGEPVSNVLVQATDPVADASYNSTSASNGIANFHLEAGTYPLTAYWNGVNVGQTNITVTGAGNFNLACALTDLKIVVQNENGTALPFVNLQITYKYGSSQTANISAQTDPSGTYILNSTLTGISYTIAASMYSRQFNSGNDTVSSLPAQAVSQVVIICPTEALTFNVVGYDNTPVSGASIKLVELTNGLFYTATTDSSGSATAQVTFGMYKLQVYESNILINETTVEAFSDGQQQIRCSLYGISVSVSVVDYFGNAISNANVTINGPASERMSAITNGDGTTTFNNVVGGNLQVIAFAAGAENSYQAVSLTVTKPTTVQIKMGGYVAFGSMLIQTSLLLSLIIILVAVILLVVVELYLRRRRRKQ